MKFRLGFIVVALCLLFLRPAFARTWTDSSGAHKVEAELLKVDGEIVHLKKADGAVIKVPLNKFCEDDQAFVRQQFAPKAAAVPVPGDKAESQVADEQPATSPYAK